MIIYKANQIANSCEYSFKRKIKFIARSIIYKKFITKLFDFFDTHTHPVYDLIISTHPRIYSKPFHPYLVYEFSIYEKINYITSHYRFIANKFKEESIDAMYSRSGINLLDIEFGDDKFIVKLFYDGSFEKEGELILSFLDAQNQRIYSVTFLFAEIEGKLHAIIGGMQGPSPSEYSQRVVRNITKAMHGVRPRDFMIFITRQICKTLKVDYLNAISTKYHAGHSRKPRHAEKFKADYDIYWIESGGIFNGYFFSLPIVENRKSFDEIKSNKRSMYTKRFLMLDKFSIDIENILNATTYGD